MALLIAVAIIAFSISGVLGFLTHQSSRWSLVDTLYYPLAAGGVILLFVSNANQRRVLELTQLAATHRAEVNALLDAKPDVRVSADPGLTDSSLGIIETVSSYADACRRVPSVNPRCTVASEMKPEIDKLLQASRAPATSPELRLLNTCLAAAQMVQNLAEKRTLPEEFRKHYRAALDRKLNPQAFDEAEQVAKDFHAQALGRIEPVRHLLKDDTDVNRFVLEKMRYEAELGTTILQGLYPCIVAPQDELAKLIQWTSATQSKEQSLRETEAEMARAKEATGNPLVVWISLNLWPWVLIFALSLKFGRGVAAVRKGFKSAKVDAVSPPMAGVDSARSDVDDLNQNKIEAEGAQPPDQLAEVTKDHNSDPGRRQGL